MMEHMIIGAQYPLLLQERSEQTFVAGRQIRVLVQEISIDLGQLQNQMSGWCEMLVAAKASQLIAQERERILTAVRALNPEAASAVEQALAANLTLGRIGPPTSGSGG